MTTPEFRLYETKDRATCLSIFDQNVPDFFGTNERADLEKFLDDLPCPYFVLELDGHIIGSCGYGTEGDNKDTGVFSWGMITPNHHKKGYGTLLAEKRLNAMRQDPNSATVRINTSQHTAPFYARFGFETIKVTKDGFADGLDDVEMLLTF